MVTRREPKLSHPPALTTQCWPSRVPRSRNTAPGKAGGHLSSRHRAPLARHLILFFHGRGSEGWLTAGAPGSPERGTLTSLCDPGPLTASLWASMGLHLQRREPDSTEAKVHTPHGHVGPARPQPDRRPQSRENTLPGGAEAGVCRGDGAEAGTMGKLGESFSCC